MRALLVLALLAALGGCALRCKPCLSARPAYDFARGERVLAQTSSPVERMRAEAELGLAYWKASCPRPDADGLCARVVTLPAEQSCYPHFRTSVVRHPDTLARAEQHLDEAMRLWENGVLVAGLRPAEDAALITECTEAAGDVQLALADLRYEAFLAVRRPTGLDFSPAHKEESQARFKTWLDAKDAALDAAHGAYSAITHAASAGSDAWKGTIVAGIERQAQLKDDLADAVFATEIPADLRGDAASAATYCAAIESHSTPLRDKAVEGYRVCLRQARAAIVVDAWSDLCRHRFNQLRPTEWPE
jgi:hypothetical protein